MGTLARALSVSLSPGLPRELWREAADCVVLHEPNPLVGTLLAIHRPARRLIVWHHSDIVRPAWANPTYGRVQRALYRRADCVIVAAPPLAEHSAAVRGSRRVEVIPYGIAGDGLGPAGRSIRPARWAGRSRGCPSRACCTSGDWCTTRASTCCWRRWPGRVAVWRSSARGRSRATLRGHIGALGLGDRVVLLGRCTDDEVRGLYQRCDVFVLPSTAADRGVRARAGGGDDERRAGDQHGPADRRAVGQRARRHRSRGATG